MVPLKTGVFWTGGSLNPARSFGPAVAIRHFHTTQWIYWVGPLAGSILAVLLYKLIKILEYETANPDPEAPAGPTGVIARPRSNDTDIEASKNLNEKPPLPGMERRVEGNGTNGQLSDGYKRA